MRIYPFAAELPSLEDIADLDQFFLTAKEAYNKYTELQWLRRLAAPALFVYEISLPDRLCRGFIGAVAMDDYRQGFIKPHEATLQAKEQQQARLLVERRASVKPVLLTHMAQASLSRYLQQLSQEQPALELHLSAVGETHRLWAITDPPAIERLQQLSRECLPTAIIADGHHRIGAADYLRQAEHPQATDRLMCACFPIDDLRIYNFNRLIQLGDLMSVADLTARLNRLGQIETLAEATAPASQQEITIYFAGQWYRLRWHDTVLAERDRDPLRCLDTNLLHELIIDKALRIEGAAESWRMEFLEGVRGPEYVAARADAAAVPSIGFCLPPIGRKTFVKLAAADCLLPPKSTWFEPRMKNALVVQRL